MTGSSGKPTVWVINTQITGELGSRQGIAEKINPDYPLSIYRRSIQLKYVNVSKKNSKLRV